MEHDGAAHRPSRRGQRSGLGHTGGRRRRRGRRHLAGLRRHRARRRHRRRLHHGRRPPLRSVDRRGAGHRRHDEPADPLRRRPDEPGVVRDDEPRRRQGTDFVHPRRAQRADHRPVATGRVPCRRVARHRHRRQPDHAPHRAGHRSDAARPGAVHLGQCRGGANDRARSRARLPDRSRLPRPMHRRARRRRHHGGDARRGPAPRRGMAAAGRRRHQRRDRARLHRSTVRGVEPHRPGVRGCPDLVRPARHGRGHRARAHRPRHARAALQGHRLRPVERRPRLRRGDRRPDDQRRLRLGHHRGDRRDVSRRCHRFRRRRARREGRELSAHRRRRPHLPLRALPHARRRVVDHSERRARHPTRQGGVARRHRSADGLRRCRRPRRHALGRSVRRPHRSVVRPRSRARARCPARRRAVGGQRRRRRRSAPCCR